MKDEINAIIEKNLPAQVGEALKKRLEQADNDAAKISVMTEQVKSERETSDSLRAEIREYEKFNDRNAALDKREKDLAERERLQEVTELKTQVVEANKRADMVVNFTSGLVRNTDFRRTVFNNEHQNGYTSSQGQWVNDRNFNSNGTEEHKAE